MTTEQEEKQAEAVLPVSSVKPKSVSPWLKIMLAFALGGAAISTYLVLQWRQEAQSELQMLRTKLLVMKTQQENALTTLNSTALSVKAANEQRDLLEKKMSTVLQNQAYRTNDWLLLKARYYLELAQINATWGIDTQTTGSLLRQADDLLTNLHDERVLEIRRAIAQEIAAVDVIENVDVAGLLSQLDAAEELVSSLKTQSIPTPVSNSDVTTPNSNKEALGWRARLQASVHALEKLVVIRRIDTDAQPFVAPAYAALLQGRIQLVLQEVQLAVLQRNEPLYQLTLKQAIQQVNRSFDLNDSNTKALLLQLKALQQQTIMQKKINIGQALLLLNQAIDIKQDEKPKVDAIVPESKEAGVPVS